MTKNHIDTVLAKFLAEGQSLEIILTECIVLIFLDRTVDTNLRAIERILVVRVSSLTEVKRISRIELQPFCDIDIDTGNITDYDVDFD